MAAPRGRGLRPGGVVRALLRLLVLIALGFGLGLLFGVVTEEPELLAGHLAGESESVSLDEMGSQRKGTSSGTLETRPAEAVDSERLVADAAAPAATPAARPAPSAKQSAERVPLPRVAAAPTVRDRRAEAPAAVAAPVVRAVAAPESAMRQIEDRWSIQVGAFSDEGAAERLAEGLRARYPVDVLPASSDGGRWRVRVQPIRGEGRAREMAEELKRDERLPTWVTPMEGRAGR